MKLKNLFRIKPLSELQANENDAKKLHRHLGAFDLTMLGVGAIIGSGIFVITGVAAAKYAGPALVLSFVAAGLASLFAALVYAELAAMVPVAGSAYTYSYAALGEIIAWIIGWDLMLEYGVASAAVAIGWGGYLVSMLQSIGLTLPHFLTTPVLQGGINLPPVFIIALITALLVIGTRESALINNVVVAVKIAVVLLFIWVGFGHFDIANWKPFMPFGFNGIISGAAIIFFAYIGFDAVATAAEEVRKPARDLPIGIIASLIITTVLYITVSALLTGMVNYKTLNVPSPVAFAVLKVGVRWAAAIISLGAIAGLTSVLLVNLFGQSRIFFAMARDGLLPQTLAALHPRFKTPYLITLVTGAFAAIVAVIFPISVVAELTNIGTLTAFILVSVGIMVLRRTKPNQTRPFRTPGMPYTPLLTIIFSFYLALYLPGVTWIRFAVWLILGIIIYFLYGQRHSCMSKR